MGTSFVDEYLVKLGSSVDASGMQRFNQALREATAVSTSSASSIAGAFFKTQTELTAGFAAIGAATLGLVDKVAMADQSYRLFAMHMYMSKDAARSLKVAMDALGEPLENLTWDPELRGRTHQLIQDQLAMAPRGDFEAQMRKIRDIRFEFTRMEVEGQYLAMHVVQDFMKALGVGPDELLDKLKSFNDWVVHNIPRISSTLVSDFLPVWNDMKVIANELGHGVYVAAEAFQSFIGIMSGDDSLSDKAMTMESLAKSLEHVAHFLAVVLQGMIALETHTFAGLKSALEAIRGVISYTAGATVGVEQGSDWFEKSRKTQENDPAGLPWRGSDKWDAAKDLKGFLGSSAGYDIHSAITKYATEQGVDPALAHAIAMHESGEKQFKADGSLVRNPGSTATGVFQLLNGTAKTVGVDSTNTDGNIRGGVKLLRMMLSKYHNSLPEAIGAYQVGDGMMDKVLAGKATLSDENKGNIGNILQRMGKHGDVHVGSIVIHIDKPGATNQDVGRVVAGHIQDMQNKKVQRNLSEFQDQSWSY